MHQALFELILLFCIHSANRPTKRKVLDGFVRKARNPTPVRRIGTFLDIHVKRNKPFSDTSSESFEGINLEEWTGSQEDQNLPLVFEDIIRNLINNKTNVAEDIRISPNIRNLNNFINYLRRNKLYSAVKFTNRRNYIKRWRSKEYILSSDPTDELPISDRKQANKENQRYNGETEYARDQSGIFKAFSDSDSIAPVEIKSNVLGGALKRFLGSYNFRFLSSKLQLSKGKKKDVPGYKTVIANAFGSFSKDNARKRVILNALFDFIRVSYKSINLNSKISSEDFVKTIGRVLGEYLVTEEGLNKNDVGFDKKAKEKNELLIKFLEGYVLEIEKDFDTPTREDTGLEMFGSSNVKSLTSLRLESK